MFIWHIYQKQLYNPQPSTPSTSINFIIHQRDSQDCTHLTVYFVNPALEPAAPFLPCLRCMSLPTVPLPLLPKLLDKNPLTKSHSWLYSSVFSEVLIQLYGHYFVWSSILLMRICNILSPPFISVSANSVGVAWLGFSAVFRQADKSSHPSNT